MRNVSVYPPAGKGRHAPARTARDTRDTRSTLPAAVLVLQVGGARLEVSARAAAVALEAMGLDPLALARALRGAA